MNDFFHMGGYAFYVWMSFGVTFVVLLINIILPALHHRQALREADDFHQEESIEQMQEASGQEKKGKKH